MKRLIGIHLGAAVLPAMAAAGGKITQFNPEKI